MLLLDSGAVTRLAERSARAVALLEGLRRAELWPPTIPSCVLVECLHGDPRRDAPTNQLLKACVVDPTVTVAVARRAAELRRRARRGSAVDAILVGLAEPGGTVLTGDRQDLDALAAHAARVTIATI